MRNVDLKLIRFINAQYDMQRVEIVQLQLYSYPDDRQDIPNGVICSARTHMLMMTQYTKHVRSVN